MKAIQPSFEIIGDIDAIRVMKNLESYARVCYKSENNVSENSAERLLRNILRSGHESVIEHEKITVKVVCDRGVTHEIVRHRLASYSQESTRYCNYSKDKFGNELTFIKPCFWSEDSVSYKLWEQQMQDVEKCYLKLMENGAKPEEARSILPNSLKTEIIITMDLREWRHFFILRTSSKSHPQMREIAIPMLKKFAEMLPVIFEDIVVE